MYTLFIKKLNIENSHLINMLYRVLGILSSPLPPEFSRWTFLAELIDHLIVINTTSTTNTKIQN